MPKIILRCNYLRDAPPEHLDNFIKYIGTREGVEKIDESKALLPATVKQQNLIKQILRDIDGIKEMHEYNDYLLNPTRENASEFITLALENNLDLFGKRKNYMDYIANRPRVERIGEHGLFTDAGTPVVLPQVADEIASHKGIIWTHVISLRREDAVRLGYDSGKEWQELIRSKRAMLSKNMKIASENLKWYCAFHNESHHPHVHLVVYSKKEKEGFLTNNGIEAMRSDLAYSIFRQDFMNIYDRQNEYRSSLKENAAVVMQEMIREIQFGVCENKKIEELIIHLAERLKHTSGKKQYGYLKAPLKTVIDQIVDELAKDERVAKLYATWNEIQNEILKTYVDRLPPLQPLSTQKQFKSIKNMVIAEALNIGSHRFTFEPDHEDEMSPAEYEEYAEAGADVFDNGNALAQYALAKLYRDGNHVDIDIEKAVDLFCKSALQNNQYAAYQLGKLYLLGEDVPKDVEAAIKWLTTSAEQGNQYAQYALGKLYLIGHDIPRDRDTALKWLMASATQGNIYAQFLIERMDYFRDPSVLLVTTRLMHHLGNIFRDEQRKYSGSPHGHIDRKRQKQLREKKAAQGHAYNDHAPQQSY